jgi:hypothetical protein
MVQQLMPQGDLVPQMAVALKQLTSWDINRTLHDIQEKLDGPKNVRIDPEELSLLGYSETQIKVDAIQ